MFRNLLLLLGSAVLAHASVFAQAAIGRDTLDPAFDKIPFEQWLGEPGQPHFHWKVEVSRPELSFHQRLVASVEVSVDGKDLEGRRDHGHLIFFTQITDQQGSRYQEHSSIALDKLDPNIRKAVVESAERVFFVPGDYKLAVAVLDAVSGEHSTLQSSFRIPVPRDDFFATAWRALPPVEFIPAAESPESWYLPEIKGRLQWASNLHSQARLNVVLNIAASVAIPGTRTTPNSGLDALLPTLKALSETGSSSFSENIDVLDLARERRVFQQSAVQDLDWPSLKNSFSEANTASIDVHSLSDRQRNAQFFVSQIRKILRSSDQASVLVILTTDVAFERGEDLEPISLESLPPAKVIYVRYREPIMRIDNPYEGGMGRNRSPMGGFGRRGSLSGPALRPVIDQLAATLKPLNPHIVDVDSPGQMTRVFQEIEKDLNSATN